MAKKSKKKEPLITLDDIKNSFISSFQNDKEKFISFFKSLGKDKKMTVRAVAIFLALALYICLVVAININRPRYEVSPTSGIEFESAKVLEIIEDNTVIDESSENVLRGNMVLRVQLLTGRYKGSIYDVTNYFSALYNVKVGVGDKITVRITTTDVNTFSVALFNYNRIGGIIAVLVVFLLSVGIIGGKKGLRSLLGLVFSLVSIMFILLPLVLKGWNGLLVTLVLILAVNAVCFLLLGGFSDKTAAASIGSLGGIAASALFTAFATLVMHVDIFMTEEAELLLTTGYSFPLKMRGLFVSAVLISCAGAVMDISMNIASAVAELNELEPSTSRKQLFVSGMNIGRDAIGTMTNTLVLAFAGSSLSMMILIYSYGMSVMQLLNTDYVAVEMIMALAGSMGLIFTVPIAAAASAMIYKRSK